MSPNILTSSSSDSEPLRLPWEGICLYFSRKSHLKHKILLHPARRTVWIEEFECLRKNQIFP